MFEIEFLSDGTYSLDGEVTDILAGDRPSVLEDLRGQKVGVNVYAGLGRVSAFGIYRGARIKRIDDERGDTLHLRLKSKLSLRHRKAKNTDSPVGHLDREGNLTLYNAKACFFPFDSELELFRAEFYNLVAETKEYYKKNYQPTAKHIPKQLDNSSKIFLSQLEDFLNA